MFLAKQLFPWPFKTLVMFMDSWREKMQLYLYYWCRFQDRILLKFIAALFSRVDHFEVEFCNVVVSSDSLIWLWNLANFEDDSIIDLIIDIPIRNSEITSLAFTHRSADNKIQPIVYHLFNKKAEKHVCMNSMKSILLVSPVWSNLNGSWPIGSIPLMLFTQIVFFPLNSSTQMFLLISGVPWAS